MNKLYLIVYNRDLKRSYYKYFDKEKEMNDYIRKIKYVKSLLLIEDSRDIVYY